MRSLAFFLPILRIGLAWAQMGEGQGTYLPRPKWDEALNNPNATGRFEFGGYNITEEYPWEEDFSARAMDGWSWEFNITAAISTSGSRDINNLPSDSFIAGANLRLHPPPSIVATDDEGGNRTIPAHESWHVCFTVMNYNWSKFSKNLTVRGRTDDGSCNHMLGDECRRAIETEYRGSHNGRCHLDHWPKACHSVLGDTTVPSGTTGFSFRLPEFGMGSPNVMQWSSAWTFNNKGNTSEYDIMGQTYPVIISWGFNDTVRGERNPASLPRNTVTCVRATRAVGDQSVLPNEGDENGVGRGPGVSMWGVMAWGVGVGLVLSEL